MSSRQNITKSLMVILIILSICDDSMSQLYQSRGYPNSNGIYTPDNGFRNSGVMPSSIFQNSRIIPRNGPIFEGHRSKEGLLKRFLKNRPRVIHNFKNIRKEEDGPTWKDYIEHSMPLPNCVNFMLSFDITSRLISDAVLRDYLLEKMCHQVFFGMMLPMLTTSIGMQNYEEWQFET